MFNTRRNSMINKIAAAAVLVLLAASTSAALAHVRHAPHHARPFAGIPAPSTAPARMIEVRPGLWVGSYQCVVDLDRGGRDCSSGI
jgi:hypothetical protein